MQPGHHRTNGRGLVQGGDAEGEGEAQLLFLPHQLPDFGKLPMMKSPRSQPPVNSVHNVLLRHPPFLSPTGRSKKKRNIGWIILPSPFTRMDRLIKSRERV
jgi:hypothetical protein